MSLVNKVLRELDQRNAAASGRAMPDHVRPLPADAKRGGAGLRIVGLVVVGTIAWGAWWWLGMRGELPAVPAPAIPSPPITALAPVAVQEPKPSSPPTAENNVAPAATPAPISHSEPVGPVTPAPTFSAPDPVPAPVAAPTPAAPPRESVAPSRPTPSGGARSAPEKVQSSENKAKPAQTSTGQLRLSAQLTGSATRSEAEPDESTRGLELARTGRFADAEPVLRQVLQRKPGEHGVRQALINGLLAARRGQEAVPILREGLQLQPANVAWAISLARLQVDVGDATGAVETLAGVRPHALQQADYLAFSGALLQRLNRGAEALADYEAALRLKPGEGRWWVGYALALDQVGRSTDMRSALQRARASGNLSAELQAYVEERLK